MNTKEILDTLRLLATLSRALDNYQTEESLVGKDGLIHRLKRIAHLAQYAVDLLEGK